MASISQSRIEKDTTRPSRQMIRSRDRIALPSLNREAAQQLSIVPLSWRLRKYLDYFSQLAWSYQLISHQGLEQ